MDRSTKKKNDLLKSKDWNNNITLYEKHVKRINFTKRNNPRIKTQKEKFGLDNYINRTLFKIENQDLNK